MTLGEKELFSLNFEEEDAGAGIEVALFVEDDFRCGGGLQEAVEVEPSPIDPEPNAEEDEEDGGEEEDAPPREGGSGGKDGVGNLVGHHSKEVGRVHVRGM